LVPKRITKKGETQMKRNYAWTPDLPDHRDHIFVGVTKTLPPHVDLRPLCSPIEDQGNLGSCTGNAIVGCLEYLERKDGVPFQDLSRLFVYYQERVIEGTVSQDAGAMIRDGIKAIAKVGVCAESLYPYNITKFKTKPSDKALADAKNHLITSYARITTLQNMRQCLADGFPFVFGFSVYDSFESETVAKTGVVPMPTKTEKLLGGHAVAAVGYDDATQRFIARNSWGAGWGQNGYFTIPYQYLSNTDLADDMWTIRRGNNL
jgi:C1A family cysteine protease